MLSILVIPFTLFGWLDYRDARVELGGRKVKLQFRVLARTTAIIKKKRTQVAHYSINPFQGRKKLANLHIISASGAGGKAFSVNNLDVWDSERLINWAITSPKDAPKTD